MITRANLRSKLKFELGPKIYNLVSDELFEETLRNETLEIYSEYYPKIYRIKMLQSYAFNFIDYDGRLWKFSKFKLPEIRGGENFNEKVCWRDMKNFYMWGNDRSDIYTGLNNILTESLYLQTTTLLPHSRNYYMAYFEEPDVIFLDPKQPFFKPFTVEMKANRFLNEVHTSMGKYFRDLFVAQIKWGLYNQYKHQEGNSSFAGLEIDMKIGDYSGAKDEINNIVEIFERDWYKNPEMYNDITYFQYKN